MHFLPFTHYTMKQLPISVLDIHNRCPHILLVYFTLASCVLSSQFCILNIKLNAPTSWPSISKNDSIFKNMNAHTRTHDVDIYLTDKIWNVVFASALQSCLKTMILTIYNWIYFRNREKTCELKNQCHGTLKFHNTKKTSITFWKKVGSDGRISP